MRKLEVIAVWRDRGSWAGASVAPGNGSPLRGFAPYCSNFLRTRIPLCPPKPRLLDMTALTVPERPLLGT